MHVWQPIDLCIRRPDDTEAQLSFTWFTSRHRKYVVCCVSIQVPEIIFAELAFDFWSRPLEDFIGSMRIEHRVAGNFWINNCCVEGKTDVTRIIRIVSQHDRDEIFFFVSQIGFRKDVSKWLACDFHTRHVNVIRCLSNLRVDKYTPFRTTKRSVTRDDTDLSIPARVAN